MATIASPRSARPTERRDARVRIPELWAALAISVIWLVVLADALFGPDIVSSSAGASFARVPSAIFFAFFAWLATWAIARRAFGRRADGES